MTKVINIIAGSGSGKSTTAAGLFYEMKKRGISCELVQEWVKKWAYEGRVIEQQDQLQILEEQYEAISSLYGKVDYIITDSPYILATIYENFHFGTESTRQDALSMLQFDYDKGIDHQFYLLNRTKKFSTEGRYETEEQAIKIDVAVKEFLCYNEIEFYEMVKRKQDHKVIEILQNIGVYYE
jgi:hypothetical protein